MLKFKTLNKEIFLLCIFSTLFFIVCAFFFNDHGFNIDNKKNFLEGEVNLNYLISKKCDMDTVKSQFHGAFSFMLADLSKRLLNDRLGLLDPITSRLIVLPFLSSLFILPFYFFVKKYFNTLIAIVSVVSLLTFPEFFGFLFNDLKDIPLFIFFSLSMFCFIEWINKHSSKYLYLFFVFFALSSSIKLYSIILILILLIWMFFLPRESSNKVKELLYQYKEEILLGSIVFLLIFVAFYMPSFWGIEDKPVFIEKFINEFKYVTKKTTSNNWNYLSFMHIFYKTPIPLLLFSIVGFFQLLKRKKELLILLLILWLLIPPAIPCFPGVFRYLNGLRMFLIFLLPFSILVGVGLQFIVNKSKENRNLLTAFLFVFILYGNISAIALTYPYENLYFNELVGGLHGAQKKGLPDTHDYWLISFKEASKWLNKNAKENSTVTYVYGLPKPNELYTVYELYSLRNDITAGHAASLYKVRDIHNSYVVSVSHNRDKEASKLFNFIDVYQIIRQNGVIATIYYKV